MNVNVALKTLPAAEAIRYLQKLAPGASVFVVNNSAAQAGSPGVVLFTVRDGAGEQEAIKVTNTWLPQDLTVHARTEVLANSPALRSLLMRGLLSIVTEEIAISVLSSQTGMHEQTRINNRARGGDDLTRDADSTMLATTQQAMTAREDEFANAMSIDIINRVHTGALTVEKAIATLKALDSIIDDRELEMLMTLQMPPAISGALVEMRNARLASRTAASIATAAAPNNVPAANIAAAVAGAK